jgi:NAD-dependent SIR2 family protein deacetylase
MRKIPYTKLGIKRKKCFRCGKKATYQWMVCADNNVWRPICKECDVLLNEMVLKFMGFDNIKQKMEEYKLKILRIK